MSLGEILVVALVALFVMKPEDIPIIIRKIHEIKKYFSNLKNHTLAYLAKESKIPDDTLEDDLEELNFYLQKIISIEGHYEGEYSTKELKAKYKELVQAKIKKGKNTKSS